MSTYLLALIVSEFSYVDARDQDGGSVFGKQVRVSGLPQDLEMEGGILSFAFTTTNIKVMSKWLLIIIFLLAFFTCPT
jgi:hypothetical protein